MTTIVPPGTPAQHDPRPSICPSCGLTADNAVMVESEQLRTATYVDTSAHMWSVTWLAVA